VKALVTGADGFVGRWLIEHLQRSGDEVWEAPGRGEGAHPRRRALDVSDVQAVQAAMAWARPEAIYHLAAVAAGPDTAGDIGRAIDVTVRGTAHVLASASRLDPPPIVLIPSSGEVYGSAGAEPIDEGATPAPVSLYGATKLAQEAIGLAYHRSGGVRVAVARAFNHIGPGQREAFVVASLAMQLAKGRTGSRRPVEVRVGNLAAHRDFTDVRDVVRAYRLIMAGGHFGEPLNVASGRAVSIRDVLDRLVDASGLDVEISEDPARMRPADVPIVRGSYARLRSLTGWEPEIPLDETLRDVWTDALERTSAAGS
jgi:GDP-4-dehydro-6-deoxy-D-mannose reductase